MCITFTGRGSQLPDRIAERRSGWRRRKLEHVPWEVSWDSRGVEVVGKADLKQQVPEKCFLTKHEGNRTKESMHY